MEKNYRGNESNQASQWTPNTPENGNNDSGEKKNRKKLIIVVIIAVVAIIAIIVAISFRKTTVPAVDVSQTEESVSVAVPEATEPASTATVEETTTTVEAETNSETETESESESSVEMLDFETYAAQKGSNAINLIVWNDTMGIQERITPGTKNYPIHEGDRYAINTASTSGDILVSVRVENTILALEDNPYVELPIDASSFQRIGILIQHADGSEENFMYSLGEN
ncbi:MAG: hypothetical protein ACLTEH_00740 [Clostridia bacterium]